MAPTSCARPGSRPARPAARPTPDRAAGRSWPCSGRSSRDARDAAGSSPQLAGSRAGQGARPGSVRGTSAELDLFEDGLAALGLDLRLAHRARGGQRVGAAGLPVVAVALVVAVVALIVVALGVAVVVALIVAA